MTRIQDLAEYNVDRAHLVTLRGLAAHLANGSDGLPVGMIAVVMKVVPMSGPDQETMIHLLLDQDTIALMVSALEAGRHRSQRR